MQQQPQPMMRRGPPPKFRPFMIIVVVLSLGLLFIGLTLTIIAHWPGYTAIGNNPLKIVGPVLLAVGGISFIGCIVEVVRKGQSDKKNFTRQMQERERMMSFVTRTQSQASLGRSVQYAPVPQNPPPIQTGPLYYAGGAYPPQNPNNDPNYRGYPDNGGDEDDVFMATSSRAPSVAAGHSRNGTLDESAMGYDTVDIGYGGGAGGYEEQQQMRQDAGVVVPEPVRPTKPKTRNGGPETEAERARRERQEKKRRLKEMQSTASAS